MKLKSDLGHQSVGRFKMLKKGAEIQSGKDDKFMMQWRKLALGGV